MIKNKMTLPKCLFISISVNLHVISPWHFVKNELWKWILKSQLFFGSLKDMMLSLDLKNEAGV